MKFKIKSILASERYPASLLEIIEGKLIIPSDLLNIILPDLPRDRGVIVSGRSSVYVFSFLTSRYAHILPWIATFDPSLKGAVITATRSLNAPKIGEVITLPKSQNG